MFSTSSQQRDSLEIIFLLFWTRRNWEKMKEELRAYWHQIRTFHVEQSFFGQISYHVLVSTEKTKMKVGRVNLCLPLLLIECDSSWSQKLSSFFPSSRIGLNPANRQSLAWICRPLRKKNPSLSRERNDNRLLFLGPWRPPNSPLGTSFWIPQCPHHEGRQDVRKGRGNDCLHNTNNGGNELRQGRTQTNCARSCTEVC